MANSIPPLTLQAPRPPGIDVPYVSPAIANAKPSGGGGGGSSSSKTIYANPPFDPRVTASGAVDADGRFKAARSKLYKGRLETAPVTGFGAESTIYQLFFLYNPTSVQHSSSMDTQYLPVSVTAGDSGDPTMSEFMQISQNVSFNLLFDRTYETWDKPKSSYLATWGVLADIKVLFAMLGMYGTATIAGDSNDHFTIDGSKAVNPQALMQVTPTSAHMFRPTWAIFGPLLKYYGNINSVNVEYTHFTQAMVPNRATVQIGMQLIPKISKASLTNNQMADAAIRDYRNTTRGGTGTHINRGLFG